MRRQGLDEEEGEARRVLLAALGRAEVTSLRRNYNEGAGVFVLGRAWRAAPADATWPSLARGADLVGTTFWRARGPPAAQVSEPRRRQLEGAARGASKLIPLRAVAGFRAAARPSWLKQIANSLRMEKLRASWRRAAGCGWGGGGGRGRHLQLAGPTKRARKLKLQLIGRHAHPSI